MTPGDFTWYALSTSCSLLLLCPMFRAAAVVDKTCDIPATIACVLTSLFLAVIAVHGLHSLWWAATHGLVAVG